VEEQWKNDNKITNKPNTITQTKIMNVGRQCHLKFRPIVSKISSYCVNISFSLFVNKISIIH
jgi:hypothetical protein